MTSASKHLVPDSYLSRANQLKRRLVDFVTSGPLRTEYEEKCNAFFDLSEGADREESESICDWFVFDWIDEKGRGAIERFLSHHDDLSDRDVEILSEWEDSINSIFEVRSVADNLAQLRDMDTGDTFPVSTVAQPGQPTLERRQFVTTRLLPLGKGFVCTGPVVVLPDKEAALEALQLNRALDAMNSPEGIEQAQREQCDAFREFFGCGEISLTPSELNVKLEQFQKYLLFERRDPETNQTKAEMFKSQFGRELRLPSIPPVSEGFSPGQVSIVCDEFDGIVILPEYERFKQVFEAKDCDRAVKDSLDLLWTYIKEPEIPIVAFERVAEQTPEGVERVLQIVLGDDDFSIEHLYAMLLHYKEPVDGLEDLEDDERLWDLLDGNGGKPKRPVKTAPRKPAKAAKRTVARRNTARSGKAETTSRKASASSRKTAASPRKTTLPRRASTTPSPKTATTRGKTATSSRKIASNSRAGKASSKSKSGRPATRSKPRNTKR